MKRPSSPRGFTLIELMVALGMALAVTSAALGVLLLVVDTQREGQRRNALTRDAQLAMDMLRHDLMYTGVGVPRGYESSSSNGNILATINTVAGAAAQLRPPVRIADDDYLAFIGDLPFPNAELNGIAQPGMFFGNPPFSTSSTNRLSISSALSGCAPQASGSTSNYVCVTNTATTIPLGGSNCHGGSLTQPTCPWAQNKWQTIGGTVPLIFGSYDGRWWRSSWDMSATATNNERLMITLGRNIPISGFRARNLGGGFIAHLDRVFYSLENPDRSACTPPGCVLRRRHCWGWNISSDNPNDNDFPRAGAAAIVSSGNPASCAPPNEGTAWEAIAEDISALTFRYFDATGTELTSLPLNRGDLARVKTVRVDLTLERDVGKGKMLSYQLVRQFYLENAGGIVSNPETTNTANIGGCWAAGPLNECNPQ